MSGYSPSEERPLAAFGGLMAMYAAFAGGLGLAAFRRGLPERVSAGDLALLGVATAKLSRLLSRDRVTSPLRAPVVRFEDFTSGSEVEESPRGHGVQLALGELATCPYCLAQWVGTALLGGLLLRPRETRAVAGLLGLLAVNDAVQVAHEKLTEQSS